ncbi:F0F1 ATP synthase subunit alpha [bacterium]|nr:F0F1 ATP synthase subunit alpha [bacterium]
MQHQVVDDISSLIRRRIETFSPDSQLNELGEVIETTDGIVRVVGLQNAMLGEMIEFPNGLYGIVFNLEADQLVAIVLGKKTDVSIGDWAKCTRRIMEVPVGNALLGRVVDAIGRPIDGLGPIQTDQYRPVETKVPGVLDRTPVEQPLQTGYKVVDALIPIGRGQRELIIGDRQTGKTTLAIDTIINQRDANMICIYVAVGKKSASVVEVVETLRRHDALSYTIVVDASADDPAAMQWLAPFSGTAMAEEFMYTHQKDVLIVYDDLTKHANAYRQLSLLLRRPPGREAFPGDIFYLHSRLLERSSRLSAELGGASITALPIIETQKGDVSTYVPTNVISITDGQIFLQSDLFYSGFRPAINAGISVSRVGGKAQIEAVRKLSGKLRLELARFREKESFTAFASELDAETQLQLKRGLILVEILKQDKNSPLPVEEQVISIFLATSNLLDHVDIAMVKTIENALLERLRHHDTTLLQAIQSTQKFSPDSEAKLRDHIAHILTDLSLTPKA